MEYVPIRLSTLKTKSKVTFDVYFKMTSKFIHYIKLGDEVDETRINNLKDKKVKQLFIENKDEPKYQSYLDDCLNDVINNTSLSEVERSTAVVGVASAAVEDLHEKPETEASYNGAKRATKSMIDVMAKNPKVASELFKRLGDKEHSLLVKSAVLTSAITVSFGEFLKVDPATLLNLGMAALMHDLGLIKLPKDKQNLPATKIKEMSAEDAKIYKTHPTDAKKMLEGKPYVNKDVLDFIYQHEERKTGDGFPQGLKTLSQNQELLNMACSFDQRVTYRHMNRDDAIKDMMINELGNFELKMLTQFKTLLNEKNIL